MQELKRVKEELAGTKAWGRRVELDGARLKERTEMVEQMMDGWKSHALEAEHAKENFERQLQQVMRASVSRDEALERAAEVEQANDVCQAELAQVVKDAEEALTEEPITFR